MSNYNIDQKRFYNKKQKGLNLGFFETPLKYLLFFIILTTVSFLAYKFFNKQPTYKSIVDAPVIAADAGPHRIAPKDPGGMAVAHKDKVIYKEIDPRHPSPAYDDAA